MKSKSVQLLLAGLLVFVTPKLRADDEQALITVLQSNTNVVQKCEACKKLATIGTRTSVSALAAQLTDERVAQAARSALEKMSSLEAGAALRDALGKTSGLLKAGVIDSLGWRRDVEAVPLLKPLLLADHSTIASASARALGRIGGEQALAALESARNKVQPAVRPSVLESLMRCAEALLAEGNHNRAKRIYRSLASPKEAESVRVAANAGLIRAAGKDALKQIRRALEGNDSAAQTAALQLAGDLHDARAKKTFAELLPKSPTALQIALLALLQERGDVMAMPAVVTAAHSAHPAVRAAAFTAFGELGDTSVIPMLCEAAASGEEVEKTAARRALIVLKHGQVADALVAQLTSSPPAVQIEAIGALTARHEVSTLPKLLELARSPESSTRDAALHALTRLADGHHIKTLVTLLTDLKDEPSRDKVIGVFESLVERTTDPKTLDVTPIVQGLATSDLAARIALFKVNALFADPEVRAAFRTALKDSNERIRAGAARALCDTRDVELLPDVLELARDPSDDRLRALALEGYVRLVCKTEGVNYSDQKRAELLQPAFTLAARPKEMRMMLSGLAVVPHPLTLEMSRKAWAEPAVRAEAEIATLQIAKVLAARSDEAEAALNWLAAEATKDNIRSEAETFLRQLNTGWLAAGPYRQAGKQGQELFDVPFPPEQNDGSQITWRHAPGSPDPARAGELDLLPIADGDHCVVFAKTRVYVPTAQTVLCAIGSDDGIKLWVNGELVHANNAVRGLTPGQDKARARLQQGWNDLLAKITQHTAGCGLNLRITQENGKDVPGLRLDAHGGTSGRSPLPAAHTQTAHIPPRRDALPKSASPANSKSSLSGFCVGGYYRLERCRSSL